jgi:HTH-type transcriptional regulator/antitoxin HigA
MGKLIKTDADYHRALAEAERLIDLDPLPGTKAGDRLELLTFLISHYEESRFPIELPDPVEAIKFRMEQQGLRPRDLVPYIGSAEKVSAVLKGESRLTLKMIRSLHYGLGIPAEVLIQEPAPLTAMGGSKS